MVGSQSGVLTQDEQIQKDLMDSAGAFNAIRVALGLDPNIPEYTPQIGQQTMAAHAQLLQRFSFGPYTDQGRMDAIYGAISSKLDPGYKAQLDASPQSKAAFMQVFMGAQNYVTFLDRYYNAANGATVSPPANASNTYSAAQLTAVRDALRLVSTEAPASLTQETAKAAIDSLRANARQVGVSLKLEVTQLSDARLGQAITDKLAAERTRYFAAHPDATQGQFKTHMRDTFGVADVDAVSKVGAAMKNLVASGAFAVTPVVTPQPQPQEIVPDQATRVAMDAIRQQIFPALDIRSSGSDNAAFRADFAQASRKLASLFGIAGDPNSQAVRDQINTKLDELAAHPDLGTLRAAASAGTQAFKFAVSLKDSAMYDRLPQAIKDDPSKLFTLLDNRAQLKSSLNQVYASNILNQPQVVVARTNDTVAEPNPTGAQTGTGTVADPAAAAALDQAKQMEPQIRALATALQIPVNNQTMPQLGQALTAALAQDRARYFTQNGTATPEQYLQNLGNRSGLTGLTEQTLNGLVGGANVLSADAAAKATASGGPSGPATPEQIAFASQVVEKALMELGGIANEMGGGLGGLNIASLAGFKPPTVADGTFDTQSQDALHMVLMGLKKLGGDKKADGSYSEEIGRALLRDILYKPEFGMVREKFGVTTTFTKEEAEQFAANPEAYIESKFGGQNLNESQKKERERLMMLGEFFKSLNVLNQADKLGNERAKDVTFMGTIMEKIGQFLPDSFKNFLRDFFENSQFGKMIGGVLAMFGFPIQKIWGGKPPGTEAVREEVRNGYRRELEEAGFDHAELKRRIMSKMDDSLAFKAAERLLFHGADRGTVRRELEAALDRAALEADPDKAADIFAEELVRRGEQYQSLTPEQREEYLRAAREAYEQDVRTMPGVPTQGGTTGQTGTGPQVGTAAGVPNYSAAQITAVSSAMTLAGLSVPASGLTAAGAKIGIDEIVAKTTAVASALGVDVSVAAYDTMGRRVEDKIAEERTKFFGANADATEGQFKDHMKTLGVENLEVAGKYARAFRDIHTSGAMNLGVMPEVSVARTADNLTSTAADAVGVEVDGKRFEIVFNPNNAEFIQGPRRYSHERVGVLQNILSQNSAALELSTAPAEYMKGPGGKATDTMTRNTSMALEELLVRAQLAKGTSVDAISHKFDDTTIPVVAEYMRSKGLNEQDIKKFTDTVGELRTDMKSTDPRSKTAGPVQPHSVWDQSYIRNQVGVKVSAVPVQPVVAQPATTGEPAGPVDRYPGIKMSGQNELPEGMTVDQVFDRYKQFNTNKDDPNCAPLVFEHQGRAYAGVVEEATNTFRVIELEGYLDPNSPSSRALSNSDYKLLHDNYNWRNDSPAGIIAYIDKQLCLEPLTIQADARPAEPVVTARPSMTDNFNTQGAGGVPKSYWDLPKLGAQDLEGLDKGCLNARELTFLYDRSVGTKEIPNGGAMLTPLNAEDKARLGGDMIVSVRNTRTNELEHRLVNFEQHKIKIGNLTENYSPSATVRRLDDFLNTQYDAMSMVVSSDSVGGRVSQDYKRDHPHTVDDALKQLYDPSSNLRSYDRMRRDYIRGTGNEGEGGFQTRQMSRSQDLVEQTLPVMYRRPTAEHDHAACNGEFNDRASQAKSRADNDGFYQPKQLPAAWGSPINTATTFFGVIRHKWGGGNDEISQNTRDCGVSSPYDPVRTYETPIGGPVQIDPTPGVVDPPR